MSILSTGSLNIKFPSIVSCWPFFSFLPGTMAGANWRKVSASNFLLLALAMAMVPFWENKMPPAASPQWFRCLRRASLGPSEPPLCPATRPSFVIDRPARRALSWRMDWWELINREDRGKQTKPKAPGAAIPISLPISPSNSWTRLRYAHCNSK